MKYFLEAFRKMERLGPGSEGTTKMALEYIRNKNDITTVVDAGCGNGQQTITLAKELINAKITGVDVDDYQIERFRKNMIEHHLESRVDIVKHSMTKLPADRNSLDLIWAEGSIYIIGFENGIQYWKKYLKDEGIIACSEVTWLKDPSPENYAYWKKECPRIDYTENKIKIVEKCGYEILGTFAIPRTDWTTHFYEPLEKNLIELETKYQGIPEAMEVVNRLRYEIYLYNTYENEYGYVFYIMKNHVVH